MTVDAISHHWSAALRSETHRATPRSVTSHALFAEQKITFVLSLYEPASVGTQILHERPPQIHVDFGQQPAMDRVFMWIVLAGGPESGGRSAVLVDGSHTDGSAQR